MRPIVINSASIVRDDDTVVALSTATGTAAIALVRLSGPEAIAIVRRVFSGNIDLARAATRSAHFGTISDGGRLLDEVVAMVFRAPHSYTGEDVVEISCHGSRFIQQSLLELFVRRGARMATGGEFTLRAFLNGKMDLSQAEAVADLIAGESFAAHTTALHQMRGGYSRQIAALREELLHFASLIELELDFADQEVEFADRKQLTRLLEGIEKTLKNLSDSFSLGNAIKNGVPVTIAGPPNVGKSTLLNALLGEEKAIVSPIAGTTRDAIEDRIVLSGIEFRFIDTAGLRTTEDEIEKMGIERSRQKIDQADIVIYLLDASDATLFQREQMEEFCKRYAHKKIIVALNKTDLGKAETIDLPPRIFRISARMGSGLDELRTRLTDLVHVGDLSERTIVTNLRHYQALIRAQEAISAVKQGLLENIPGDLIAVDIQRAISFLSEITGDISDDEILGTIFSRFCIGK